MDGLPGMEASRGLSDGVRRLQFVRAEKHHRFSCRFEHYDRHFGLAILLVLAITLVGSNNVQTATALCLSIRVCDIWPRAILCSRGAHSRLWDQTTCQIKSGL